MEKTALTYHQEGDYLLPDLVPPESPKIGVWGIRWIDKPKVYISAGYNAGDSYPHQIIGKPIAGEIGSACTNLYEIASPWIEKLMQDFALSFTRVGVNTISESDAKEMTSKPLVASDYSLSIEREERA